MSATVGIVAEPAGEWDRFVCSVPGATHFHRGAWLDVVRRVHGHEVLPLGARTPDGRLVGVLPLVRVRTRLFGHYLVSMPFLNYGGPVGDDDAVRALTNHAVALAHEGRVKLLELRCRGPAPIDLPLSHRKVTVVLDLVPGQPELVFKRFKSKLRSQILRPLKEGMTVRFGPDQVGPFFGIFARRMRDLGTPVQPRRLFVAIAAAFPDDAWFGCVYHGNVPVAGGAGFAWRGEFEITWASALGQFKRSAPNMLLYWAFIERAAAAGLSAFNLGRCTPGSGTHRFKLQWGGREEPLHWYQYARDRVTATPSPDAPAYAWATRVWRHVPVPLATAVGPHLVRGIP